MLKDPIVLSRAALSVYVFPKARFGSGFFAQATCGSPSGHPNEDRDEEGGT